MKLYPFLQTANSEKLTIFINTLNGKDGNLCHLVTVPPGPLLSDALISSPILQGEDGAAPGMEYASEYGFDPNSDPELALVSVHGTCHMDKQVTTGWLQVAVGRFRAWLRKTYFNQMTK